MGPQQFGCRAHEAAGLRRDSRRDRLRDARVVLDDGREEGEGGRRAGAVGQLLLQVLEAVGRHEGAREEATDGLVGALRDDGA